MTFHRFDGMIWKLIIHPSRPLVFLEVRDEGAKQVSFSVVDVFNSSMVRSDLTFEENWWITIADAHDDLILFTMYTESENPDKKSILAYNFVTGTILWWKNNFAFSHLAGQHIVGNDTLFGWKPLALDLANGQPVSVPTDLQLVQNFSAVKPLQYYAESDYFRTVANFLITRFDVFPTDVIEYLEYDRFITVSFYVRDNDLANYLIVCNDTGETILHERIGEQLKGVGFDTFFILSGYLIFVKNKCVLVSYKLI
jgi:hypothetical protein